MVLYLYPLRLLATESLGNTEPNGCLKTLLWVPIVVGALMRRGLLFGVYIRAPDVWKLSGVNEEATKLSNISRLQQSCIRQATFFGWMYAYVMLAISN